MLHFENLSLDNIRGECWVDIKGYEGLYQVSTKGRIKSLPRFHHNMPNGGALYTQLKILKQSPCCGGLYLKVNLYKDKIQSTEMIHILVGKEFVDNRNNKPEINHKNGIKFDNRKCNLEWATSKENSSHALLNKLAVFKLTKKDVQFIRKSKISKILLSKMFNVCLSQIYRVKNGKAWSCIK